jgi:hypothetical protein
MLQETIVDKEEALQSMQAAITSIERSPYAAVGSRFRERAAERYHHSQPPHWLACVTCVR